MSNDLVLVVEDDTPIRTLFAELLQAAGLRVATLPDGERVLDLARETRPAAIVLDIGLPGRHGLAVLDELKAQPDLEDLPVVVVSAWCDSGLVDRAMAAGAFDYVRKPLDGDDFVERVKAATRSLRPPRLQEDVSRLRAEDRLTGLPNRLGLEGRFAHQLAVAQETETPLAIVMVRVDRFEEVLEQGRPAANDMLMRMLAADLTSRIRPGDGFGRIEEDTFLVIAPGCDLAAAGELADAMRAGVEAVRARGGWTASAAYAATDACEADELLACCDVALSLAAAAGGDTSRAGIPADRAQAL